MKILLRFETPLGSRTIALDGMDKDTASAIIEAHQHAGGGAAILNDQGRFDMKQHFRKLAKAKARAARKISFAENVVSLKRRS